MRAVLPAGDERLQDPWRCSARSAWSRRTRRSRRVGAGQRGEVEPVDRVVGDALQDVRPRGAAKSNVGDLARLGDPVGVGHRQSRGGRQLRRTRYLSSSTRDEVGVGVQRPRSTRQERFGRARRSSWRAGCTPARRRRRPRPDDLSSARRSRGSTRVAARRGRRRRHGRNGARSAGTWLDLDQHDAVTGAVNDRASCSALVILPPLIEHGTGRAAAGFWVRGGTAAARATAVTARLSGSAAVSRASVPTVGGAVPAGASTGAARGVAVDHAAVHDPVADHVVVVGPVHDAPVVPHHDVAGTPPVPVDVVRRGGMGVRASIVPLPLGVHAADRHAALGRRQVQGGAPGQRCRRNTGCSAASRRPPRVDAGDDMPDGSAASRWRTSGGRVSNARY